MDSITEMIKKSNEKWTQEIRASQKLPKALCVGKVFVVSVADGNVMYKVTAVKKTQVKVELVDGGLDGYKDAVLNDGGWFPKRAIEPLVVRHHAITELFSK